MTQLEKRQVAREAAMPEVKKLVKKHGRQAVQSCLNSLKDYERTLKQLESAKKEVAMLEKKIK